MPTNVSFYFPKSITISSYSSIIVPAWSFWLIVHPVESFRTASKEGHGNCEAASGKNFEDPQDAVLMNGDHGSSTQTHTQLRMTDAFLMVQYFSN
jgi:hypothetical protein